jgi:uncharacterized membrane protein
VVHRGDFALWQTAKVWHFVGVNDELSTESAPSHHGGPLRSLLGLFGAGLLVVIPLVVTIWVFNLAYQFIDGVCGPIYHALGLHLPGLGFATTILLVLATGFMATNVLGRRIIEAFEGLILSIPVVSQVYGVVKQATESVRSMKRQGGAGKFKRVAYIRMPESNGLLVGFVTGQCYEPALDKEFTLVFLPFTPNPVSGRVISVPSEEIIESALTVEQVMKIVLSAGLVTPERPFQKISE